MEKNMVQDVLPPERKSIRDIPIPNERRKKPVEDIPPATSSFDRPVTHSYEEANVSTIDLPQKKPSRIFFFSALAIALLVLVFAFSTAFGGATIFITPKKQVVVLDMPLKAYKSAMEGELAYEVITFSKTGSKVIQALEEKQVDKKASGKIILYNNEKTPQTLIKNTRFETPQGLIYRISDTISIPAGKTTNGKVEPGTLEVLVYADKEGKEYNITLTDFTIPGLVGTSRFKTLYARSKTAMTGGSKGGVLTAKETDLDITKKEIDATLQKELLEQARVEAPENFVLFDDAVFFDFESLPEESSSANSIRVVEKASLHGIIFNRALLEKNIAKESIENYDDSLALEIADIEKIKFEAPTSGDGALWNKDEIDFSLKGTVVLTLLYDESDLKKKILGKSLDTIKEILSGYPSIDKTEIVIKPFWKKNLPKNPDKIKVVKNS